MTAICWARAASGRGIRSLFAATVEHLKSCASCFDNQQDALWVSGMVEDVSHQYGENLFGICCLLPEDSSYFNVSDAVSSWYDELSDYNFRNPGYSLGTGHFTQVTMLSVAGCSLAEQQYACVCRIGSHSILFYTT